MSTLLHPCKNRRGALSPLAAIMIVPLLAMAAFSVDVGWIGLTKSQMKNAADSAAIAAAGQLIGPYVQYNLPQQSQQSCLLNSAQTTARTYARQYAGYNRAGGVALLQLNDADIEFGFTDAQNNYQSPAPSGYFPNTVRATLRRDETSNTPLGLFFARIFGINSTNLQAVAAATIQTASAIEGFRSDLAVNGLLMPVALDVNVWNRFLATGQSSDGIVHAGPNGVPQLHVYPCPSNAPGNFGLVCVGWPGSDTPGFEDWIDFGSTSVDLQYLMTHGKMPVSPDAPKWWDGGPGMKSTLQSNFLGQIGKPRLIPLFKPVSTDPYQAASNGGSRSYYAVVGFAGITITEASASGSNMNIALQPVAVLDPTAVYQTSSVRHAGTDGLVTTAAAPKLTQ